MLSSGWLASYSGSVGSACINNYSLGFLCFTVTGGAVTDINMLKGRGMAVFQQMRTAVMFATVTQKCDTSEVKFSLPSKNPINTERGVVAIRKGARPATTGFVAASQDALCDIAAMSAHEAKDRLIKGVPYVVRRQGAAALAEYVNNPEKTGGRYSLPCNTGPKGSGKTVLQRQNMLQVARDFGFLAVEIEFNGIQPLGDSKYEANFARRVANRILCYLPKYCALEWSECLQQIAQDFEWDESTTSDVTKAVQVLKKALNHKGPVLLAVDELVRVPSGINFELTDLCAIMDYSQGRHQQQDPACRVYVRLCGPGRTSHWFEPPPGAPEAATHPACVARLECGELLAGLVEGVLQQGEMCCCGREAADTLRNRGDAADPERGSPATGRSPDQESG